MKKRLLACVVFCAFGFSAVAFAVEEPVLELRKGERVLVLPKSARKVLESRYPGFQPWKRMDFIPSIATYRHSPRNTLFAIVGDFNGDGRQDVAVMGHTKAHALTLVLVSKDASYEIREIATEPYKDPRLMRYNLGPSYDEFGLFTYLQYVPPGELQFLDEQLYIQRFELETDAFEIVYDESANHAYAWVDGKFKWFQTSD